MNNVTELYRKLELPNSFAPGNFIRKKDFKAVIKKHKYEKTDDGYLFDDGLTEIYTQWFSPEEKEMATEDKTETTSESYSSYIELTKLIGENNSADYVNKLFSWFVMNDNYYTLTEKFGDNCLKYAIGNFDICIATYLTVIRNHVRLNRNRINRNEIRTLCRDIKKSFSQIWCSQYNDPKVFSTDKANYVLSHTNHIKEQLKNGQP